ncbi:MAG: tetratricopeptide repeat protein [Ferruginibacter sp.]|nr:tetratricopeptide repeat protein [Ferruginibacter sp.]
MLKRFLPFLLLLFFFSAAQAQVSKAVQHYKAGIQLKNNNQLSEAFAEFNKAIELNKNYDSAYVEMAHIYFKSGKMDLAITNFNKALSVNPGYADAYVGMAKIYRDAIKQYDTAIFYFNEAAKYDSKNKEIFYGIAWIHNARKQHELAIPYAVKALEIDNNYKPAYGELGYAYNSTKKYAECIEQMKKNLAVSVVDVAYLYSGLCYIELKNKEGAMQQYEALLKVNERMAGSLKKKIDAMPAN